jgi:hypothetical protein
MTTFDTIPLCLSGGADGADVQWGMTAGFAKHSVIHWSFLGHRTKAPESEVVILTQEQLDEADPYLMEAAKTLKRYWPPKNQYVRNLLRRNWLQVRDSDSCYAISSINRLDPCERLELETEIKGTVNGGTGWAVEMFLNKHKREACKCFVFDQEACSWFEWSGNETWIRIYEAPKPSGVWAGIGTRDLNQMGKLAIRVLMDYRPSINSPHYHGENYPWKGGLARRDIPPMDHRRA